MTRREQNWVVGVVAFFHSLPFFIGTVFLHFQLGKHFPLVLPEQVWNNDATQAGIRSYIKLSWILLAVSALLLMLALFLPPRFRRWTLGPVLGCVAGAVASFFLIPIYF